MVALVIGISVTAAVVWMYVRDERRAQASHERHMARLRAEATPNERVRIATTPGGVFLTYGEFKRIAVSWSDLPALLAWIDRNGGGDLVVPGDRLRDGKRVPCVVIHVDAVAVSALREDLQRLVTAVEKSRVTSGRPALCAIDGGRSAAAVAAESNAVPEAPDADA